MNFNQHLFFFFFFFSIRFAAFTVPDLEKKPTAEVYRPPMGALTKVKNVLKKLILNKLSLKQFHLLLQQNRRLSVNETRFWSKVYGHLVYIYGAFVWDQSGIRIYSCYFVLGSRIAGMASKYSGMGIAPKRTLICIIPTILFPV